MLERLRRTNKTILTATLALQLGVFSACLQVQNDSIRSHAINLACELQSQPDAISDELLVEVSNCVDNTLERGSQRLVTSSIQLAHDIIKQKFNSSIHKSVRIFIHTDTYFNQSVRWTFLPLSQGAPLSTQVTIEGNPQKSAPVFDGTNSNASAFFVFDTQNVPGFSKGGSTALNFRHIHIKNYYNGILISTNRDEENLAISGNTIEKCTFENIGDRYLPISDKFVSYAAIDLVNVRNTRILNNRFKNIQSIKNAGGLHAIYLAHQSQNNQIQGNVFEDLTCFAVKFRDYSNSNTVDNNTFKNVGSTPWCNKNAAADWYCFPIPGRTCTKTTPECPSWNNKIENNELYNSNEGSTYTGDNATNCQKPAASDKRFLFNNNVSH